MSAFNESHNQFWLAKTNHAATKEILEVALDQYHDMSISPEVPSPWAPQEYMEDMAAELVSGEMPYIEGEGTDEMWPSWCSLVVTPAIHATIDWALIHRAVNERWNFWLKNDFTD